MTRPETVPEARIVCLDTDTIGPSVTLTRPGVPHHWQSFARTTAGQVVERLRGVTIAVLNKVPLRRAHLEQLPDLRFVAIAATGYDNVDVEACRERDIMVSNVRGYAVNTGPEHTIALILALRRSLVGFRQDVIDGAWQQARQFCFFNHTIKDLAGSRMGIIGAGSIGRSVARLARGLGMIPLFAAHKGRQGLGSLYTPFEEVLETADVITLHAPLTPSTRDILALPEFCRMGQKPLIINTARGGLVNEADVVTALEEGLIAGIGFDVLTAEPPSADNPLLRVLDRPNVIVTPHVAWASDEAMQILWHQVVENIEAFLSGHPVRALT